jgi:tRNA(Ile)-lysidine synthase
VHELATQLLKTIRKQDSMRAGDRVAAALSGGADSVALLCLLLELRSDLGIVLSVAHVNHQLRDQESDDDEQFVARLAEQHGLELHLRHAPLRAPSEGNHNSTSSTIGSGIEAAARQLRYDFFRKLAHDGLVSKIATAHSLDDQAETVLLRIFRGTGIRGLAGIHPRITFHEQGRVFGEIVRPLLGFRRATLQKFLRERGLSWRHDSSNQNLAFLRNRVRHRLLPIIAEEFGDAAIEHMSDLAEIARAEAEAQEQEEAEQWALSSRQWPVGEPKLDAERLLALPLAAQRRLVRAWIEATAPGVKTSFRLIEEILDLARGPAGKKLELPPGRFLRRNRQDLSLESNALESDAIHRGANHARARVTEEAADKASDKTAGKVAGKVADYEYALAIPGSISVPELCACIEARIVDPSHVPPNERGQLLDPRFLPNQVLIRNWRPGDRYWPAHTVAAKKVKELLTDRHATGSEKKLWPVAVANNSGIVWLRGFPAPAALRAPADASRAICIRDCPKKIARA